MMLPSTRFESLGVWVPPRAVSSADIVRGCAQPVALQLERLTGIRHRRMAGGGIHAFDLAIRAVEKCLAHSRYSPGDVELVICCNMSRRDEEDALATVEPGTAIRLCAHFGFTRAQAFDVNNACAGMFTAIHLADAMLRAGQVRTVLVVSGEYITHLTRTAQLEIAAAIDPRMACLTLGDCGAAVLLDRRAEPGFGLHAIDLYTAGAHAELSVARPSTQAHGGAIMFTDSRGLHEVAIRQSAAHIARTARAVGWGREHLRHVLIHQTSERFFYEAAFQVNEFVQEEWCGEHNMLDNLAERGNTATTTHFLAVWDSILDGRLQSGERMLFAIQASGLTIGSAAYTFDDLPDRIRRAESAGLACAKQPIAGETTFAPSTAVTIAGLGLADSGPEGLQRLTRAIGQCLEDAQRDPASIPMLIHAGVHRDQFLGEPAIAALAAREAGLHPQGPDDAGQVLAFDLTNGGAGFLQACHAAAAHLHAGNVPAVLVAASEVENNRGLAGTSRRGIAEVGSALLLERAAGGGGGFGRFLFRTFPEHVGALRSRIVQAGGVASLDFECTPDYEAHCVSCVQATVRELLALEGLSAGDIDLVVAPQRSSAFVARLREAWPSSRTAFIDAAAASGDLFTSSTAWGLARAREQGLAKPGALALIAEVGAGIQVGCAIYRF